MIQIGTRWFIQHDETHGRETAVASDGEDELSEPDFFVKIEMGEEIDSDQDDCCLLEEEIVKDKLESSESGLPENDVYRREEDEYGLIADFADGSDPNGIDDDVPIRKRSSRQTAAKPYQCSVCNAFLSSSQSANRHMRNIHGIQGDYNEFIQLAFLLEGEGKRTSCRRRIPPAEKPHQCSICDKKFRSAAIAHSHVESDHNIRENVDASVRLAAYKSPYTIWSHGEQEISREDFGMMRVHCTICDKLLTGHAAALHHLKHKHHLTDKVHLYVKVVSKRKASDYPSNVRSCRNAQGSRWNRPHECMICNKVLTSSMNAYVHLKVYHKIYDNYKTFARVEGAATSADNLPHKCLICNQLLLDLREAYKHIRKKHPSNTVLSQQVEVANVDPSECKIDEGMEVDPDPDGADKPHKCTICNTVFIKLTKARRHLKAHHKILREINDFVEQATDTAADDDCVIIS